MHYHLFRVCLQSLKRLILFLQNCNSYSGTLPIRVPAQSSFCTTKAGILEVPPRQTLDVSDIQDRQLDRVTPRAKTHPQENIPSETDNPLLAFKDFGLLWLYQVSI